MSPRTPSRSARREGRTAFPAVSRLCLLSLLLGWVLLGSAVDGRAQGPVSKEYQIKAAFLYNYIKFVEWPAPSQNASQPIVIGVWGGNPFGDALGSTVRDRKINGRTIVVKQVRTAAAARATHLLFVSAADDARFGELREALKGSGVLTVGESESFAQQGGMIFFTLDGDKLRFEINMNAAEQAGLKISAQLQKLARAIRRKP